MRTCARECEAIVCLSALTRGRQAGQALFTRSIGSGRSAGRSLWSGLVCSGSVCFVWMHHRLEQAASSSIGVPGRLSFAGAEDIAAAAAACILSVDVVAISFSMCLGCTRLLLTQLAPRPQSGGNHYTTTTTTTGYRAESKRARASAQEQAQTYVAWSCVSKLVTAAKRWSKRASE